MYNSHLIVESNYILREGLKIKKYLSFQRREFIINIVYYNTKYNKNRYKTDIQTAPTKTQFYGNCY